MIVAQREHLGDLDRLMTPAERVVPVGDEEVRKRLGLSPCPVTEA